MLAKAQAWKAETCEKSWAFNSYEAQITTAPERRQISISRAVRFLKLTAVLMVFFKSGATVDQ